MSVFNMIANHQEQSHLRQHFPIVFDVLQPDGACSDLLAQSGSDVSAFWAINGLAAHSD
jgi:hypothetical protein